MIGVPVKKTTLQLLALNINSYNCVDSDVFLVLILFTILLTKLCASSIIITLLSNGLLVCSISSACVIILARCSSLIPL